MSIQNTYETRILPAVGGSMINVRVEANDVWQARSLVESLYGPVKVWQLGPTVVPKGR